MATFSSILGVSTQVTLTGAETLTNKTLVTPVITDGIQVVSTNTTATRSITYVLSSAVNITLPATPIAGDWVIVVNASGTTTPTVLRNGQRIMSLLEDFTIDSKNVSLKFTYTDSTRGWVLQ